MNNNQRKVKTISGFKWSMLSQIVLQGSNFLIGILLTRLLTPDVFGLIAMITVFTGFLTVFQDFGLGSYLIYKKKVDDIDLNTIFYTHMLIGVILAVITFSASGYISSFYNNEVLKLITMVIALNFIIQPLTYVQFTILKKELDFRRLFFVNTIAVFISGIIAVYMAYNGYGIWSIVARLLLNSIVQTIVLWVVGIWVPKLIFSKSSLKQALNYSLPLIGNNTIGYFSRNTDSLIIGKVLGSVSLGIYNRAYSLMMLPINQIGGMVSSVLFSSFSLINNDINTFRSNWLKINRYLAFIIFPLSTLIFLLAEPFVLVVLGKQWTESIPIIKILAIAGAAQGMSYVGFVFNALGETKLNFWISLFINSILILAIIFSVQYGIIVLTYSYTTITVLLYPTVYWFFIAKKLKISFLKIYTKIFKFLISSIIIGILFWYIFILLRVDMFLQLILGSILYPIIYIFTLQVLRDNTFIEIKRLLIK